MRCTWIRGGGRSSRVGRGWWSFLLSRVMRIEPVVWRSELRQTQCLRERLMERRRRLLSSLRAIPLDSQSHSTALKSSVRQRRHPADTPPPPPQLISLHKTISRAPAKPSTQPPPEQPPPMPTQSSTRSGETARLPATQIRPAPTQYSSLYRRSSRRPPQLAPSPSHLNHHRHRAYEGFFD